MQAWAGFAGAAAVLWAAHKGSQTFGSWLRQKQTERKIDVGERILTVSYQARDTFRAIRSPGSTGGDISSAEAKLRDTMEGFDGFSRGKKRSLTTAQVTLSRIYDQADLWKAFFDVLPMVRAYFGQDFEGKFRTIWAQRATIYAAAITYGDIDPELMDQAQMLERRNNFEAIIWEGWAAALGRPDAISENIESLIVDAEALILPIISSSVMDAGR